MPEFLWRAAHADGQAAEGRTEAAAEADEEEWDEHNILVVYEGCKDKACCT